MADTLATLTAGERSLILKLQTPTDWNNTKVRNDLSAVKVWISTTSGFTPGDGNLVFNGPPAASITIPALTPSTTYYVKYAFISSIQPDVYTYSQQYSATVNAENVNTATAYAYQWGTTQPSVDSTTGTYTWATAGITSFPSGWSATVPAVPGTGYSLYRLGKKLAATASTQTSSIAWNTGTVENISYIGINGIQTAYVYAYYWANTTPSINSTSATYTWSTGQISARPTSPVTWTATPSTGGLGSTLYEAALKIQAIAGDTQTSVNWSNATISTVGYNGTNGVNAITGFLNNQTATVPANSAGTVSTFVNAVSTMYVYVGSTDDSANWTYTKEDGTGITSTISGRTVTVTGLSSDTGYITITASRSGYTSIPQIFTVTKAKTGVAGNDATAYWLTNSIAAIQRNINGSYSPTTITVYGYSATGTNGPALYAGRFKIYEDGSLKYTSSGNESSSTYTPSSTSISNFKVELYLAGGTTTKIDEQIIPVVSDGATGATGAQTHRVYYAGNSFQPNTPSNTTSGAAPSGWSLSPVTLSTTGNTTQWQSDGFTAAGSTTTTWSTPYLSYFKVANLSAITADLGTITAGSITGVSLQVGNTPAINGITMSGSGGKINTDGTFALGNSSTNITYNGTTMYLNGDVVATGNIKNNAVTVDKVGRNVLDFRGYTWYAVPGQYNFTVPEGVYRVNVTLWGGGGAGLGLIDYEYDVPTGRDSDNQTIWTTYNATVYAPGGTGGKVSAIINVQPGDVIPLYVGKGASAPSSALFNPDTPANQLVTVTADSGETSQFGLANQGTSGLVYLTVTGGSGGMLSGLYSNQNHIYYGNPGSKGSGAASSIISYTNPSARLSYSRGVLFDGTMYNYVIGGSEGSGAGGGGGSGFSGGGGGGEFYHAYQGTPNTSTYYGITGTSPAGNGTNSTRTGSTTIGGTGGIGLLSDGSTPGSTYNSQKGIGNQYGAGGGAGGCFIQW